MELRKWGDPIFREETLLVSEITEELKKFIFRLIAAMDEYGAIGLAAPQLGRQEKLFVMKGALVEQEEPLVAINPRLRDPSKEENELEEGSPSIPGIRLLIRRPSAITLEALNVEGVSYRKRLEGLAARVAMHENDHLNCVLFPDRASRTDRKRVAPQLRLLARKEKG